MSKLKSIPFLRFLKSQGKKSLQFHEQQLYCQFDGTLFQNIAQQDILPIIFSPETPNFSFPMSGCTIILTSHVQHLIRSFRGNCKFLLIILHFNENSIRQNYETKICRDILMCTVQQGRSDARSSNQCIPRRNLVSFIIFLKSWKGRIYKTPPYSQQNSIDSKIPICKL